MEILERVIRENTGWLFSFLRGRTGDRETAEDLVQEVWLRVFRAWDGYREDGKLRAWLKRIAMNVYLNHIAGGAPWICVSLDGCGADEDPLADILTDGVTAEDLVMEQSLTEEVISALAKLPENQRRVLTYRYLFDMTIPEVAKKLDMAPGSVKSSTHYGLSALRKQLGADMVRKGERNMECRDVMQYLYVYAAGLPEMDKRTEVEAHLKECPDCWKIAEALRELIPQMMVVDEGCLGHWNINFPKTVTYSFIGNPVEEYEWCSKKLQEWNGCIPEDYNWYGSGFSGTVEPGKKFDNEGHEILYEIVPQDRDGYYRIRTTYMRKIFPYLRQYQMYYEKDINWSTIDEHGIHHGLYNNHLGHAAKIALYQMIPKAAKNIRIRQGNGVLDCGEYWAVYAERYCNENETICIKYTFTME